MKMKELEKDELLRVDGGRGFRDLVKSYYGGDVYDRAERSERKLRERSRVDEREVHRDDRGKSGSRRMR